jgi:hypothetical protein
MHANFAQVKNISCVAVSSDTSCLGDARVLKFVGAYLDRKYYSMITVSCDRVTDEIT